MSSLQALDVMGWLLVAGVALIGLLIWACLRFDQIERERFDERRKGQP